MGRRKLIDKGPRNIDLDILLYGDETVSHERLKVPHIGIPEREFVLRPLAEYVANAGLSLGYIELTHDFQAYTWKAAIRYEAVEIGPGLYE